MKRRDLLKFMGLAGLTTLVNTNSLAFPKSGVSAKKSLQVAQITDIHLQPEEDAPRRLTNLLRHLHNNFPDVDFILNTGDTIMDALVANRSRADLQWKIWNDIIAKETFLQIKNCIGNHDIWGGGSLSDPMYGKALAMDALNMESRYYSFNKNGWHFIVLDSSQINSNGEWYTAYLDEQQFDWLIDDLEKTPKHTPVLVASHVPILSASTFFCGDSDRAEPGYWKFPQSWMHGDARKISSLFEKYPNVKLAVSGHMHMVDKVDYKGVSYLCNGSVCAKWWEGSYHGHKSGYAIIDLFDDGSFDSNYIEIENL
ncbi:MAG: metallophosphoesterase [Bacteroidota bacterium]|nr:metallophosphoesterase [Bacteroidota bacterium]